ncbi:hypothetical protein GIB67_010219 [Kingdonia uniflora]|uniref:Uncharacterized protein n=1 Tax=Kingdonia uniflora TaxID=39325 RepID=A0A7J7NAE6_9MAGN|nr:hypothetical protein GIB67_010219 [Kingdonia uniflora]
MTETNLIGEIPKLVSDLASLEYFDLALNKLSGKIPNGLFLLKNLTVVYLYSNLLSREIPKVVEASKLVEIYLSMNKLSGSIPERFGELQDLKELALYRNELSGEMPKGIGEIPSLADV